MIVLCRKDMIREELTDDCGKKYHIYPDTEIVRFGEAVHTNCGIEYLPLTDKELRALNDGRCVWVDINCGEYALVIGREVKDDT